MIKIENLSFYYSDSEKPALQDINLSIHDGEFTLITGPSGSGKSSLIRCFNGLIPNFYGGKLEGRVEVQGLNIKDHPTNKLSTKVGMIFQDPENQLVSTDIEREIAFGLENLGIHKNTIVKRIEESLDIVGIAHLRRADIQTLSGGEKQKIAIASVLALHPEILVLDEPTSQLDPKGAEEILNIIERLNDELGITVVLIEHRLDRVVNYVDRIIVMHEGRIIADGNPREILGKVEIQKIGIGIPPVVKLAQHLQAKSGQVGKLPLTVKESRMILDKILRNPCGTVLFNKVQHHSDKVIDIESLYYTYPTGTTALRNVNLTINEGEFIAVIGRNASGKTTLVKHFNGLLKPTKGKVIVRGVDTREATIADLSKIVGYIFQNPNDHLFADTVEEEIALTVKHLNLPKHDAELKIKLALEKFGLSQFKDQYPRSLSGGEKQRVALASVTVTNPKILVLDEPTRGMEYGLKMELMNFLDEYRKEGNTVILVTHDVETIAEHADRVIFLSEGRVIADGSAREVLSEALLFSPQINRLIKPYGKYGLPRDILTVNEALRVLK